VLCYCRSIYLLYKSKRS